MTSRSSQLFFSFTRNLILYTGIIAVLAIIINHYLPFRWRTPALPYLILLFFSINIVIHYVLLKASEKKISGFVNYYLVTTLVKLSLYILVLVVYIYWHRSDALAFGVTFFILYLLYTLFEVYSLTRFRYHQISNDPGPKARDDSSGTSVS